MNPLSPARHRITRISGLLMLILCLLFAGCDATISTGGNNSSSSSSSSGTCLFDCATGSGTNGVQLYVEPDAGEKVITDAISGAKKSVWLEMYLLTDKNVISALEEAAHNGIDVRVMLETHPYGGGSVSPTETLDKLSAAGVKTKATSPSFSLTHEKGMVIDGQTAYIMTSNFTLAALGAGKSTKNREYGIIDTNADDVKGVIDIFNADWNRSQVNITDPNLVVSPINSRAAFESLINGAKKSLVIEAEEMQDKGIEQDLVNAAKKGVKVQVILPASTSSSSGDGNGDSNSAGIQTISQGGVSVKEDHHLYMHAKIIVADGQKAFVGSENISNASLEGNRELGIVLSDQNVINTLQQTFQTDWSASQSV